MFPASSSFLLLPADCLQQHCASLLLPKPPLKRRKGKIHMTSSTNSSQRLLSATEWKSQSRNRTEPKPRNWLSKLVFQHWNWTQTSYPTVALILNLNQTLNHKTVSPRWQESLPAANWGQGLCHWWCSDIPSGTHQKWCYHFASDTWTLWHLGKDSMVNVASTMDVLPKYQSVPTESVIGWCHFHCMPEVTSLMTEA